MSNEGQRFYPGETATPQQIIALANEYRCAAETLLRTGRPRQPLSHAPLRLIAIHAVELYLNAFLRTAGHSHASLRSLQHNLASRAGLALEAKLRLKVRTETHLRSITDTREYLLSRYDPEASPAFHLNRLEATLKEVAKKVTEVVNRPAAGSTATGHGAPTPSPAPASGTLSPPP